MTKKLTKEEKAANLAARRAKAAKEKGVKPAKAPKAAKKSASGKVTPLHKARKPAAAGHNSGGEVNEALREIFSDYFKAEQDKKAIAKHQRDLRAKAKEEHGVTSDNFTHEIRLQKWDNDRRVMFETGANDLKGMLGIQLSLNLLNGEDDEDSEDDADGVDPLDAARRAAEAS